MSLETAQKIHVVGTGGIGISAIAKLLVARGKRVTGSDAQDSEIVREAAAAGIKTMIGHAAKNLSDAEVLIYSEAVPRDNPERVAARERSIPEYSGAEALAELTKGKRLIAVAGTNGKSTTTALAGLLLEVGGFDPTIIVGSKVPSFSWGNVRIGKSDWWVVEADEYQAKFLQLEPEIAVITNIAEDHLDYFRDLAHIHETFQQFLDRVKPTGKIILNADDAPSMNDLKHTRTLVTYGMHNHADYKIGQHELRREWQWFSVEKNGEQVSECQIRLPGSFNVMNALAALAVAFEVGVKTEKSKAVCESFGGLWRRFERVGEFQGATVISDYGHHPVSVAATVRAAREFYPGHRIVLVFQPHHHHRTKALFHNFVKSFADADVLVLSDVYQVVGRDEGGEVGSENLAQATRAAGKPAEVHYAGDLKKTEALARELAKNGDIIICMGAGDIDTVARNLVK